MTKLADIKKAFSEYVILADPWIVDIILATLIGNALIERDPLWTMIIAPSSGGKTTLIAPCAGAPGVTFIDDLTEKTFLSGYKVKGGKETSLLARMGSGVMAFSDFTSILTKNPVSKGEILTQMRLIYDGNFVKNTGTGEVKWSGKMGFLGASTPEIYPLLESARSMGERFMYYWMEQPSDSEIIAKQKTVSISSKEITEIMKEMYGDYCVGVRDFKASNGLAPLSVTEEQRDLIREAAMFCVNGKTSIHTNFKTGKIDQIPNKPGVGRDNKMFDTLLHALQLMDAYEHDDPKRPVSDERITMVQKCAYSSITRERRKVLEVMVANDKPMTAVEIGAQEGLGLEKATIEQFLLPLYAVGLVAKDTTNASRHKWYVREEGTKSFVKRVSLNVTENTIYKGTNTPEVEENEGADEYEEENKLLDSQFDQV